MNTCSGNWRKSDKPAIDVPRFTRTRPAPKVMGDYSAFRSYVRRDFEARCAYCLVAELWAAGEENFELDHFRPRSRFPELIGDFYNLYYACRPCNLKKHSTWPSPELQAQGIGFVDLCEDDVETHYSQLANGRWEALTPSAAYTIDALRLNRAHLVTLRLVLAELGLPS